MELINSIGNEKVRKVEENIRLKKNQIKHIEEDNMKIQLPYDEN